MIHLPRVTILTTQSEQMFEEASRVLQSRDQPADPPITCGIGKVTSFSGGGARIETQGWPTVQENQTVELTMRQGPDAWPLLARVCWVRRTGANRGQVGLAFVQTDEPTQRRLNALAAAAAPNAARRPTRRLRDPQRPTRRPAPRPTPQPA